MERKYILTDETYTSFDYIFHRIQAVRDFGYVKAGDLGGWIESEYNLSHDGLCWVHGDAMVYDKAKIYGDARVYDDAQVFGDATVRENATVFDDARVFGNVEVRGKAKVYGNATIRGNAVVYGRALICNKARIFCNAEVCGTAMVDGSTELSKNAFITSTSDYLVIGPIGSRCDYTTFYRTKDDIWVSCGCFNNSIDEFEKTVKRVHCGACWESEYLDAIEYVKKSRLMDK